MTYKDEANALKAYLSTLEPGSDEHTKKSIMYHDVMYDYYYSKGDEAKCRYHRRQMEKFIAIKH